MNTFIVYYCPKYDLCLEACILTIKKHNSRSVTIGNYEGKASQSQNNNKDRNAPIAANQGVTNSDTVNIQPHRLMKTSSIAVETSRSTSQSDSIVRQTSKINLS